MKEGWRSEEDYPKGTDHRASRQLCRNVHRRLSAEIQRTLGELREQQKRFLAQKRELEGLSRPSFLEMAAEKVLEMGAFEVVQEDAQEVDLEGLQAQRREIAGLVRSVVELNHMFEQMNQLVLRQGSIIDRIDANIAFAEEKVAEAVDTLGRAQQRQKKTSRCACIVIGVLLFAIGVLTIVLCVKWFSR